MPGKFPTFPTIPNPRPELGSLVDTVMAMKRTLEMVTNTDTQSRDANRKNVWATHTFVQMEEPTAINEGDLWLCTGQKYSFSVWDGVVWLKIADLPNVGPTVRNVVEQALARSR